MALVKCEECGHMMSDAAQRCPKCGCPTSIHFMEIYYEGSSTFVTKGTIKLKVNGEEINHGGNSKDGLSTKILLKESPITVGLSTFGNLRKVDFILDVNPAKNSRLELKYDNDIGFFTEAEYLVEGDEVIVVKASKGDKRKVYIFCIIVPILVIIGCIYVGYKRLQNSREETRKYFNELIYEQKEETKSEVTSPSEESNNMVNSVPKLTVESIGDCFLRHWQHYKGDRELIPLEGCSEGFKIFISDLNSDGADDAVVNAYVTPSSEEIVKNSVDNKSYIFCFLNDNGRCKLVIATRLNTMFFVDNIVNGEIYAHRIEYMKRMPDRKKTAVKDSHIFKYDGDRLVDLGGKKKVLDEKESLEMKQGNEDKGLLEGWYYYYEGDMGGFPVKVDFGLLEEDVISGEYQNVKYGTVLDLRGQLNSDNTLQLVGENQNEKIVFELSFSSPDYLNGYGRIGDKSLKIKLKQISSEEVDDSH